MDYFKTADFKAMVQQINSIGARAQGLDPDNITIFKLAKLNRDVLACHMGKILTAQEMGETSPYGPQETTQIAKSYRLQR